MKKQWNLINSLMGRNSYLKNNVHKLVVEGLEHTDAAEISDLFNMYFCSIADNLESSLPPISLNNVMQIENIANSFYLHSVTENECLDVIKKLKLTGTGLNSMSVRVFKLISPIIIPIFCKLVNYSFNNGIFPESLKLARITPVHKKGDETDPNNYRPIASLPFLSKVYERLMANRLISFIEKFKIIDVSQFGFQRNKSTTDALYHLTEYIYSNLDDKKQFPSK